MSIKFNKWLHARLVKHAETCGLNDWVWLGTCWKPVKAYRTVTRGKRKGQIQVTLYDPTGCKKIVPSRYMRYKEILT